MFSKAEKQKIAAAVEKLLLSFNHPEMPTEKPLFKLHVNGKEAWSFADIDPNWCYDEEMIPPNVNPWNEQSREDLKANTEKFNLIFKKRDN